MHESSNEVKVDFWNLLQLNEAYQFITIPWNQKLQILGIPCIGKRRRPIWYAIEAFVVLHHVVCGLVGYGLRKAGMYQLCNCCNRPIEINPKGGRGGVESRHSSGDRLPFLQEPPRDLKILDFFKNDIKPRIKESFWAYLEWLSRKQTEFDKNLQIFWGENHKLQFFQKCWK